MQQQRQIEAYQTKENILFYNIMKINIAGNSINY